MEDPDRDSELRSLDPEVDMGGGEHGVTGGDECGPALHGILDDVIAFLDLCPVQDLDLLSEEGLEFLDLGADEGGGVEFGIDLVAFLEGVEGLHGHTVGTAETETDENEFRCHWYCEDGRVYKLA